MAEEEKDQAAEAAVSAKGAKRWLLIGIPALLLLLAAAGGYLWWSADSGVAEAAEAAEESAAPDPGRAMPGGIVTLNPFTVNLRDADSSYYLRVTIELTVATSEEAAELTTDVVRLTRARAAILEVLTQQRASDLATPEGKTVVKAAIADVANEAIAPVEVMDVLFTDFVIQF